MMKCDGQIKSVGERFSVKVKSGILYKKVKIKC